MWYVYIVRCRDSSLYTGISTNVQDRLKRHNSKRAAKYTRTRTPVTLLHTEKFATRSEAQKREIEIKSFNKEEKKELIGLRE